ncbi:hypothetical protein Bca101_083179 [Brassica carinata]
MNRTCSAHMADVKGKGICYEDDDGPIQLTDQGDSPLIRDYRLSLIGKILNPKKQTVVKLLQTMPAQWKMQDRITANDLGNGNFLLNFSNEEDLQSVLRQGPFHYNFCIFVLVRWEPVVHDDYPWVIPFWVEITGIPLHLWAIRNLEDIGRRLGHIDTVELTVGRMLIDVDTRKPLTFTRKIASPEGEEVSIQIHYEKLFEHCSTCRMLTHETAYCPSKITDSTSQNGRTGVFARVQLPDADDSRQPSLRNGNPLTLYDRYDGKSRSRNSSPSRKRGNEGGFMSDARRAHHSDTYHDRYGRSRDEFEKRREPTQRGLAGVARKHVSSRHNSRYAPYDAHEILVARRSEQESYARSSPPGRDVRASSKPTEMMEQSHQQNSGKRLASQIVTPNIEWTKTSMLQNVVEMLLECYHSLLRRMYYRWMLRS